MAAEPFDAENFPEDQYLAAFRDIGEAVAAGLFESGYAHYLVFGAAEIANGIRAWPFDREPAASAVLVNLAAGLRDLDPPPPVPPAPSLTTDPPVDGAIPYLLPPEPVLTYKTEEELFSEALYLAINPDIAGAIADGAVASALDHWRKHGREEEAAGKRPSLARDELYESMPPPGIDTPIDTSRFDAESYLLLYPDVRERLGNSHEAALHHWVHHGRLEARVGTGIAPFGSWRARPAEVLAKPFGINVFGPFGATSGLGTAARNLLAALLTTGIPLQLHPFDVTGGKARITPGERARPAEFRTNLILANADQIARLTALYPEGFFDDTYNIAVWAWELAAFRSDWHGSFAPLDEVWTNSEFELQSIGASSPVPVHKIRLPVEVTNPPAAQGRDMFGIPHDRLVFLVAFDVGSTAARKNPRLVVDAFREAFAPDASVFLVIKFHATAVDPAITRQLTQALRGAENVLVIAERLCEPDMSLLRAACDCFVSAHRSEGFGLNIAEFLALGKPVIATGYSGNLEFFDESVGYPIDYRLIEIETEVGPYKPHAIWADPDRGSLVAQFRRVHENQAEAWARGQAGALRMRENFSPTRIGQDIRQRLHAIGLAADLPPFLAWFGRTRGMIGAAPVANLSPAQKQAITSLGNRRPVISLITPVYNVPAAFLKACILSVMAQSYPFWELCLCDDASTDPETLATLGALQGIDPRVRIRTLTQNQGIAGASNIAVEMASGEFIAMLDNDDELHRDALLEVARALFADSSIDVLYTDEDKIDEQGHLIDTYFKPDWSPEHLESVMYVLHMLVVRKRLFLELGGFRQEYSGAQDYDLMLRLSRRTQHVHHIQKSLYHWRAVEGSAAAVVDAKPYALEAGFRALQDHVKARHGASAWVEAGLLPGTFRVRRRVLGNPRVTLIILTNNTELELEGRGRFHMVDNMVDSILRRTAYRNYEVLVVDNSKLSEEQLERFQALGVRVENFTGPTIPFNYAAKANFAVRACRTEHLVLLNDDMEVINDDWLTSLLEISQDPEIGAVGARLFHADGTVQHVGCVIGVNGGSAHVYHSFPGDFIGYNGFTHLIRNYSAVTGACLATRKSVLSLANGLDESFALDFNDTDLCLRIIDRGFRVVYTPYAQLFHFEGRSAKRSTQSADERRRFVARWARYMENDPYFNPNFAKERFDFTVA